MTVCLPMNNVSGTSYGNHWFEVFVAVVLLLAPCRKCGVLPPLGTDVLPWFWRRKCSGYVGSGFLMGRWAPLPPPTTDPFCRRWGQIHTHAHIYIYILNKYLNVGLVVRVSGYRYRGPGFDPRRYQIFWVVVGLGRGPLSLVRSIEELLEWKK